MIAYLDKAIRQLVLIMSKMSGYVKTFKVQEVHKVKTINRCLSLWTMRSYLKSPSRHLP